MDLESLNQEYIQNMIFTIRSNQVMIDRDLAEMYQVQTKVLNQAVKRNEDRFPETFRFQLTEKEKDELVTICDRFENLKHSSANPYAFTEQGVAMLSTVLRSKIAVKVSIKIMEAFVKMRKFLESNSGLFQRIEHLELRQIKTEEKIDLVFKALEKRESPVEQGVFFDGQIFDAYSFISKLVKSAHKSIVLIDNYVDESVLTILSKKKKNVHCIILTKTISPQLKLDIEKFNKQYPKIEIREFNRSHDRFLILDESEVYHVGASMKDLGKKWFGFTKMKSTSSVILESLKGLI